MSEFDLSKTTLRPQTDWGEHYNQTDGASKVAARRRVYLECLEEGAQPVDFDDEAFDAIESTGLSDTARLVDIGCSYPKTLEKWQKKSVQKGHFYREYIGIEPNTNQFNGLRFWQPKKVDQPFEGVEIGKIDASFKTLYWGGLGKAIMGIELIDSNANQLPLDDGSTDVAAFMFSFYHILRDLQEPAIDEARRVLKKVEDGKDEVGGMFLLATSGNENKDGMRQNESAIAQVLTDLTGSIIQPPEPLNSGFTSEDAAIILPRKFKYVYEFKHQGKIVIKNEAEKEILLAAYRTLRDKYRDESGQVPDEATFEEALRVVVGEQIDKAETEGRQVEDKLRQSLFVASDVSLNLPVKFKPLTAVTDEQF